MREKLKGPYYGKDPDKEVHAWVDGKDWDRLWHALPRHGIVTYVLTSLFHAFIQALKNNGIEGYTAANLSRIKGIVEGVTFPRVDRSGRVVSDGRREESSRVGVARAAAESTEEAVVGEKAGEETDG